MQGRRGIFVPSKRGSLTAVVPDYGHALLISVEGTHAVDLANWFNVRWVIVTADAGALKS
jgi:hypothetical protein